MWGHEAEGCPLVSLWRGCCCGAAVCLQDTITLTVTWENLADGTQGTGIYTSSWSAPKADVHSQQRFFYLGQSGEVWV